MSNLMQHDTSYYKICDERTQLCTLMKLTETSIYDSAP